VEWELVPNKPPRQYQQVAVFVETHLTKHLEQEQVVVLIEQVVELIDQQVVVLVIVESILVVAEPVDIDPQEVVVASTESFLVAAAEVVVVHKHLEEETEIALAAASQILFGLQDQQGGTVTESNG